MFKKSLEDFLRKSKLATQPGVDFRVDQPLQPHRQRTRYEILSSTTSLDLRHPQSLRLTNRYQIGEVDGDLSPFTLMILSGYEDGDTRRW